MKSYKGLVSRYIKNEKRSIIPIFISIILTVSVITSVAFITQNIMRNDFEEKKIEFGDYDVRLQKINSERLEKIKKHENIKDYAIGKSDTLVNSVKSREDGKVKYHIPVEEYAIEKKFFDEYINFKVVDGRLPDGENEVVVDRMLLSYLEGDTKIGDSIEFTKVDGDISELNIDENVKIEGEIVNYIIVGIIETNPDDILFSNKMVRLLSEDEIANSEELEVFTYLNDSLKVEELANDLGIKYILPNRNMNELPFGYPASDIKYPGYEKYEYTNIIKNGVAISIIAVISLFCLMAVYNTFHASIAKRIRVYGILRAIGGSMNQIRNLIYLEGLILYVVATPIGILLGYVLTKFQSYILVEKINALEKFTMDFNLELIIITLLATFIIVVYSIISVLRKESKLTPIEAIADARGLGRKKKSLGTNLIGQSLSGSGSDEDEREAVKEILNYEKKTLKFKIMKKIFKFEGEVAHKNITRDANTYKLSKRTLFIAMAILIVFYVQGINDAVRINDIGSEKKWDIQMSFKEESFESDVIEEIESVTGVEGIYRTSSEAVHLYVPNEILSSELKAILVDSPIKDIEGKDTQKVSAEIMTLDEKAMELYEGIDKEALDNGGVLLVDNATNWKPMHDAYVYMHSKNVLDAKESDKLLLIPKNTTIKEGYFEEVYNTNINVDELNIVGNVEDNLIYSTYKSTNRSELKYNIKLLTTEEGLKKIVDPYENNKILIKTTNNEERKKTIEELKKISANNNYEFKDVDGIKLKLEKNLKENLGLNIIFTTTIIIMVVLNLVNTTNAVILSRKKELAGMRAIGMSGDQQRRMIIAEGFYMFISVAFIVMVTVGAYAFINQGVNIGAGKVSVVTLISGEIIIIIFLMIISNLTSLAPIAQARKFSIVDDLKDE